MNIGIDLDGVVYNSENWFMAFGEVYDINNNGKGIVDSTTNNFQKRYGLSYEKAKEIRLKYLPIQMKESPLMPFVKEVLRLLKQNHKLYIITSRGSMSNEHIEITKQKLKEDKIDVDEVIFSQESKLNICRQKKIDLMIDDGFNVVKELSENNIKCLQFNADNTKCVTNENVIIVHNWGEVYRQITILDKESKNEKM